MKRFGLLIAILASAASISGAAVGQVTGYVQVAPPNGKQTGGYNIGLSTITTLCFDDGTCQSTASGGSGGVTSLNGHTGAQTIVGGTNVTVSSTPTTVTINSSGGGSSTPAGPFNAVQYNSTGTFNGNANFTTDGSSVVYSTGIIGSLTVNHGIITSTLTANSSFTPQITIENPQFAGSFNAGLQFLFGTNLLGYINQQEANTLCSDASTTCMVSPLGYGPSSGSLDFGIDQNGKLSVGSYTGSRSTATVWGNMLIGSGYPTIHNAPLNGLQIQGSEIIDSSLTVSGALGENVSFNLNVGSMTGAGLSSCSGASNAVVYFSSGSTFGCNTITGGSSGSGLTYSSFTATSPIVYNGAGNFSLTSGSTNYIQNTSTLQSGSTFYVSSGSVAGAFTSQDYLQSTGDSSIFNHGLSGSGVNGVVMYQDGINGRISDYVGELGNLLLNSNFTAISGGNGTSHFVIDAASGTFDNPFIFSGNVFVSSGLLANGSAGSNGQVLTSGGAGSIPTWTTVSGGGGGGTGTINAANQFSLPYYSLNLSSNILSGFQGVTLSTNTGVSATVPTTLSAGLTFSTMTGNAFNASATSVTVTGSSGFAVLSSSAGQEAVSEGSQSTVFGAASSIDLLWADSTGHTFEFNPNNTSTYTVVGTSVTPTQGHLATWGSNGWSLVDGGATGNQTITLTGDVTGNGTATIATTAATTQTNIKNFTQPITHTSSTTFDDTTAGDTFIASFSTAPVITTGTVAAGLWIGANGNIGISTTSAISRLTINDNANGSNLLIISSASNVGFTLNNTQNGGIDSWLFEDSGPQAAIPNAFRIVNSTDNFQGNIRTGITDRLDILVNGYIGIGTTTPSAQLEVYGFTQLDSSVTISSSSTPSLLMIDTATTGVPLINVSSTVAVNPTDSLLNISSPSASTMIFGIDLAGNVISSGTTPAASSCGTTGLTIAGTNFAFRVTPGSTATGCTITFANGGFTNTPVCQITQETMSLVNALTVTPTATTYTISQVGAASNVYDVHCIGNKDIFQRNSVLIQ